MTFNETMFEEQQHIINELQKELKYRKNENVEMQRTIEHLKSELVDAINDYKQAVNEIRLLNKQIDKLIAENNDLRLRRKMFVKTLLNQLYGSCYVDTDSIKETKDNDNNN